MKLMNFRRFDPTFTDVGKVGLSHGGKAEEAVWNEFASDPARCHEVAATFKGRSPVRQKVRRSVISLMRRSRRPMRAGS